MILQNISKAIRAQNWFAVVLEFVIVIAGVVIGFQIQAWNEARQADARERQILERLLAETAAAVVYLDQRVGLNDRFVSDLEYALATFQRGGVDDADTGRVIRGLSTTGFFPATAPPRAVQDELINSGRSADLNSSDVREALGRYNAELSFISGQLDYFRTTAFWIPEAYPGLYVARYDADAGERVRLDVDLPAVMANSEIRSHLAFALRNQIVFLRYRQDVHSAALHLCQTLAAELDTTCRTGPETAREEIAE